MKKENPEDAGKVHTFDLKAKFLFEAIEQVELTNRFLDTKAGVLVSIESTLLFVVVGLLFDSEKFNAIKASVLTMPFMGALILLLYCAIYVLVLVAHILYTIRVLNPAKNPQMYVQTGNYKPRGLFFLGKNKTTGKMTPSLEEYVSQLGDCSEQDILSELTFEFMKVSYIRDKKSDNIHNSLSILKYMIAGIMVFGIILVLSY
jgi:hypothetical protein